MESAWTNGASQVGYPFESNAELKTAVGLWFTDRTEAEDTYGLIGTWDTREITDMRGLFCGYPECGIDYYGLAYNSFNEDISGWNTGKVTTFWGMFYGAGIFDQLASAQP